MSTPSSTQAALRRAAFVIQRLEQRLAAEERARTEPIAIIGTSCRLPGGVTDLDSFWELLTSGRDVLREVPAERFDVQAVYDADPNAPGKSYTRSGSFIDDVDRFDAAFFGVSPREAAWIDPQHRLFVECTWEALERAGVSGRVRGAQVGVYVGIGSSDYGHDRSTRNAEGYLATGTGTSFVAGRVSYLLGLHGPAIAIDTACSSSLVAIHVACNALRCRECEVAVAGGVQVMLSAEPFVLLSRLRALSPDGRCKTFSAHADGYGRGEGCGVLVLKRLADAKRDGDPILALIRGSAVNHDGASSGLTTPNGSAQKAVIKAALASAVLQPRDVQYVEAHGTGTSLGDPIEVEALSESYAEGRTERLRIGSLKANIGHLESAAGVASVLKVVAAFQHDLLPHNPHAEPLSAQVNWASLPLQVVLKQEAWPRAGNARIAGVSAFGMSGTNAHLLLEEAPVFEPEAAPERSAELVVLSAKTPEALGAVARRLREHLAAHPDLGLGDVAYSLVTTRTLLEERLTLSVPSRSALLEALAAAERGETPAGAERGSVRTSPGRLAWLFTGQGAQRLGMGQALYGEWPVFREALDAVCALFDAQLAEPLCEVMWAEPGSQKAALLDQTGYTQPALFAIEWALSALWRSWGIEPDFVLGHSIGEVTAAAIAGVFSLEDAVRLVAARSRLMQALPPGGAMLSLAASEDEVRQAVAPFAARVSVAAINGPASVVIAGDEAHVAALAERFSSRGVKTQWLIVSHAFHSPRMEPILEAFREVAASLHYQPPRIALVSDTTGRLAGADVTTAEYWVRHVRETVRFAAGVQTLSKLGADTFFELGPRPTLLSLVAASAPERELMLLASLRSSRPESEALLESLGGWVARGGSAQWKGVFPAAGRRVPLPTYPWQRTRYWIEGRVVDQRMAGAPADSTLLGHRISAAGADAAYETSFSSQEPAWLANHRTGEQVVVEGSIFAELVRRAAEDSARGAVRELSELVVQTPLVLPLSGACRIQVLISRGSTRAFVYSRPEPANVGAAWTLHVTARLDESSLPTSRRIDLAGTRGRCLESVDVGSLHPPKGTNRIWRGDGEAIAEVDVQDKRQLDGALPGLLDLAIQAATSLLDVPPASRLFSTAMGRYAVYQLDATSAVVHVKLLESTPPGMLVVHLTLCDPSGALIAEIHELTLSQVDATALGRPESLAPFGDLFRIEWQAAAPTTPAIALSGSWRILSSKGAEDAEPLARELTALGAGSSTLQTMPSGELTHTDHLVCLFDEDGFEDPAHGAQRAAIQALETAQFLARECQRPRVWWVTRSALATSDAEDVRCASATIWGIGRTLMQERSDLSLKLLDLGPEVSLSSVLRYEVDADDGETQVAWRGGSRRVPRLVPVFRAPMKSGARAPLRTEGTALITGGLGALGVEVARALAQRGVRHLLLTSRRGMNAPGADQIVAELERCGARVTLAAVDVADRGALSAVLAGIPHEYPLRGIIHAAGVLDDGLLQDQTAERFARVMHPKVHGAWNLHELTAHVDLDLFVLFSSVAAAFGSAGQSGYAAANAFLDALAASRHHHGLPALSIAWGPWLDRGLAAQLDERLRHRIARRGMGGISPDQGRALFQESLTFGESHVVAASLDFRILSRELGGRIPGVWRALVRTPRLPVEVGLRSWRQSLVSMPPDERLPAVIDAVRHEVAGVLASSATSEIPIDISLKDLGLDSLMALELRNALGARAAVSVRSMFTFDTESVQAIAGRLLSEMLEVGPALSAGNPTTSTTAAPAVKRAAVGEVLARLASPTARLFCLHDAGGSPSMFSPFVALARQGIEVHTLTPASQRLAREGGPRDYLREAVDYVRLRSDLPFGFFGHSLGGLFAWRITEELALLDQPLPKFCAPSCIRFAAPGGVARLLDLDLVVQTIAMRFKDIATDTLEMLRRDAATDIALFDNLPAAGGVPLHVPLVAFAADADTLVTANDMLSWRPRTSAGFALNVIQGDHFYVYEEQPRGELLQQLSRLLRTHAENDEV